MTRNAPIIYLNNDSCCEIAGSRCQRELLAGFESRMLRDYSGLSLTIVRDDSGLLKELDRTKNVRGIVAHLGCSGDLLTPETLNEINKKSIPLVVYVKEGIWKYQDMLLGNAKYIEKRQMKPDKLPKVVASHFNLELAKNPPYYPRNRMECPLDE